jgi:hypothetical protein
MSGTRRPTKVDPTLRKRLSSSESEDAPIQAVLSLRSNDSAVSPQDTDRLAREVLDRVAQQVGAGPDDFNIFPNLSSLVVSAKPAFLRELLQQPEVRSALANQQPDDALIRPRSKRKVS